MKVVIFGKGKVGMATDLTLKTNADFHDVVLSRTLQNMIQQSFVCLH